MILSENYRPEGVTMREPILLARDWANLASQFFTPLEVRGSHAVTGNFVGKHVGRVKLSKLRASGHFGYRTEALAQAHPDSLVVGLVTHGEVTVQQQNRSLPLRPGQVALYSAAEEFRVGSLANFGLCLALVPMSEITVDPERVSGGTVRPLSRSLNAQLRAALLNALSSTRDEDSTRLLSILSSLPTWGSSHHRAELAHRNISGEAMEYIDEHFCLEGLTGETIAHALGISARSLYNHFRLEGVSVAQYLQLRRLRHAYQLLTEGSVETVLEAATESGFRNLSHFSRCFKQEFGVSPSVIQKFSHQSDSAGMS